MYMNFTPGSNVRIHDVIVGEASIAIMVKSDELTVIWRLPCNIIKTISEFLNMLEPENFTSCQKTDDEVTTIIKKDGVALNNHHDGTFSICIFHKKENAFINFDSYEEVENFKNDFYTPELMEAILC